MWELFDKTLDQIVDETIGLFQKYFLFVATLAGIIYFLFLIGFITIEKPKPVTYNPTFNATKVQNIRCDECFVPTTNPNYVFYANQTVR